MAQSINTTFAKLGVQLGGASVADSARAFGFDRDLPGRLSAVRSRFPDPAKMDTAHVAQASFGQGEVLATPLEMALVASGIANGGKIMAPYLVSEVRDYQQTVLQKTQPREWLQATDSATAATVRDLMVGVVTEGTGKKATIDGVQVAGKTGTAELDKGEPHAWFIGFAPASDPRVAVAVIVENGGTGGSVAAPMAAQVMRAALQQ
jgi:peptidoglycan glycosyltransferase